MRRGRRAAGLRVPPCSRGVQAAPAVPHAVPQVARLALLSLLAVFRDVLPGYRIRPPSDKELAMPVSRDVRRTRDHEAGLLRLYQARLGPYTSAGTPVATLPARGDATNHRMNARSGSYQANPF